MEVTVSGFHGSFYFGTSEYADGKENKLKVINMCVCLIFDSRSGKIKTKITGSKWFERKEDIKQMRLPQIINSLLETDMYKFSMGVFILEPVNMLTEKKIN